MMMRGNAPARLKRSAVVLSTEQWDHMMQGQDSSEQTIARLAEEVRVLGEQVAKAEGDLDHAVSHANAYADRITALEKVLTLAMAERDRAVEMQKIVEGDNDLDHLRVERDIALSGSYAAQSKVAELRLLLGAVDGETTHAAACRIMTELSNLRAMYTRDTERSP